MADYINSLYSGKILDGDFEIYLGTPKQNLPSDINTTSTGALTLSGFTQLSMKESAIKPKYTQSYNPVVVRESRAPIWYYPEEEGMGITFELKRADFDALKYAIGACSVSTVSPGAGQVGQSIFNFGDAPVNAYSMLLYMLNKDSYYRLYHLPIVIPMEDVEQEMDRANAQIIPFTFAACADLTQSKGQRLMRVYDMTAAKVS